MPLSNAIGRPTKKTLLVEEKLGPMDEKLNIFPTWDLSKSVKNYKSKSFYRVLRGKCKDQISFDTVDIINNNVVISERFLYR